MLRGWCRHIGGGLLAVPLAGRVCPGSQVTRPVRVSPDGSTACCAWADAVAFGWFLPLAVATSEDVVWCDLDAPQHVRRVRVQGHFGSPWFPVDHVVELAYAPDGRHIAARTFRRCMLIDVQRGASRQVAGPPVLAAAWAGPYLFSFAWIGSERFVYVRHESSDGRPVRRAWRQDLPAGSNCPELLYEGPGVDMMTLPYDREAWTPEQWSPDRRYAVFVQPHPHGKVLLLDTGAGPMHRIGDRTWGPYWVAWQGGGTQALCVGEDPAGIVQAVRIDRKTYETTHMALLPDGQRVVEFLSKDQAVVRPLATAGEE